MTKFDHVKLASVAAPLLVGIGLFIFAAGQRSKLAHDTTQRQGIESQITSLLRSMEAEDKRPIGRQAAVADTPNEESAYLTMQRFAAQTCGVKIVRWAENPRTGPMTGQPNKPANPLLSDVTPISGLIEVSGNYRQILAFARQLESADRLLNLSVVGWIRSDNGSDVHMSATITRYVVPAPPSAVSAPAPTKS